MIDVRLSSVAVLSASASSSASSLAAESSTTGEGEGGDCLFEQQGKEDGGMDEQQDDGLRRG